jgi:hypothetical protein
MVYIGIFDYNIADLNLWDEKIQSAFWEKKRQKITAATSSITIFKAMRNLNRVINIRSKKAGL